MTDVEEITLCAVRYALGRASYVVSDVDKWVRGIENPSSHFVEICARDISEQLERNTDTRYADVWRELRDYLLTKKEDV